jgi:enediyne polyketide synthase
MTTLVKTVTSEAVTSSKQANRSTKATFSSAPLFSAESQKQVQIKWLDSGKPVLEGLESQEVEVSLSHDDRFCLCVAGTGPQGCDVVPVSHRSSADWTSLLSNKWELLLNQLLENGSETVDIAGTRLWAAIEAVRKAVDVRDIALSIDSQQGDTVLFQGKAGGKQLYVMTFPVSFTQGSQRIIAVIVSKK